VPPAPQATVKALAKVVAPLTERQAELLAAYKALHAQAERWRAAIAVLDAGGETSEGGAAAEAAELLRVELAEAYSHRRKDEEQIEADLDRKHRATAIAGSVPAPAQLAAEPKPEPATWGSSLSAVGRSVLGSFWSKKKAPELEQAEEGSRAASPQHPRQQDLDARARPDPGDESDDDDPLEVVRAVMLDGDGGGGSTSDLTAQDVADYATGVLGMADSRGP